MILAGVIGDILPMSGEWVKAAIASAVGNCGGWRFAGQTSVGPQTDKIPWFFVQHLA
jgi:hypothetical protein